MDEYVVPSNIKCVLQSLRDCFHVNYFMVIIIKVKGIVLTLGLIWTDGYHCPPKASATVVPSYCTVPYFEVWHTTTRSSTPHLAIAPYKNTISYRTIIQVEHRPLDCSLPLPLPLLLPAPFTLCLFSNWLHFSTSSPHCPE